MSVPAETSSVEGSIRPKPTTHLEPMIEYPRDNQNWKQGELLERIIEHHRRLRLYSDPVERIHVARYAD